MNKSKYFDKLTPLSEYLICKTFIFPLPIVIISDFDALVNRVQVHRKLMPEKNPLVENTALNPLLVTRMLSVIPIFIPVKNPDLVLL